MRRSSRTHLMKARGLLPVWLPKLAELVDPWRMPTVPAASKGVPLISRCSTHGDPPHCDQEISTLWQMNSRYAAETFLEKIDQRSATQKERAGASWLTHKSLRSSSSMPCHSGPLCR